MFIMFRAYIVKVSCRAAICVFSKSSDKSCERKCLVKTFNFDNHICS